MARTARINSKLKSAYIYSGGKSMVAQTVWDRIGNPDVYAEPFLGSAAVLLKRPLKHFDPKHGARLENATDLNFFIPNFWRAVQRDPEAVARFADSPVSEIDLHARHRYLTRGPTAKTFQRSMIDDPDYFDAKFAGWWCWGMNLWIGGAWCHDAFVDNNQMPSMGQDGHGVTAAAKPIVDWDQTPRLGDAGTGTSGVGGSAGGSAPAGPRPQLADAYGIGRGTSANWKAGTCAQRRAWLVDWMQRLADRLCRVRVLYGDWKRLVNSDSLLTRGGTKTVGVFLDPPYPTKTKDGKKSRDGDLYATDKHSDLDALRDDVLAWCREHGANPLIRICVCGYESDGYEALIADGWEEVAWEASGGFANLTRKEKGDNAKRERLWFSPACAVAVGPSLFDGFA